jgi:hypothetical protein
MAINKTINVTQVGTQYSAKIRYEDTVSGDRWSEGLGTHSISDIEQVISWKEEVVANAQTDLTNWQSILQEAKDLESANP